MQAFTVYSPVSALYASILASGKPVARRGKEPGAVTARTRTQSPTSNNGTAAKYASPVGSAPPLDFLGKSSSSRGALAVTSCAAVAAFEAAAASAAVASILTGCAAVKATEA